MEDTKSIEKNTPEFEAIASESECSNCLCTNLDKEKYRIIGIDEVNTWRENNREIMNHVNSNESRLNKLNNEIEILKDSIKSKEKFLIVYTVSVLSAYFAVNIWDYFRR